MPETTQQPAAPANVVDDDFTITAAEPAGQAAAAEAAAPTKFRRVIDLGDGSGKQVFEADSAEELLDKLTEAQTNATRHIRQLTREASVRKAAVPDRPEPTPVYAPKQIGAEQEFVIAQSLSTRPTQAIRQALEAVTGIPAEKLAEAVNRLNALEYNYASDRAALEFVAEHADDYVACPENSAAMTQFLTENQLPGTRNNLEFAFEALSHRGVLVTPEGEGTERSEGAAAESVSAARIEQPARRATGLSGRRTSVAPAPELTDDELMHLPLDALRSRIVSAGRTAQS